jgi:hypothetical protein
MGAIKGEPMNRDRHQHAQPSCECTTCKGSKGDPSADCINQMGLPLGDDRGAEHDRQREAERAPEGQAMTNGGAERAEVVTLDDFYAYMPMNGYLFTPTCEMWVATSVNARLASPDGEGKASAWLSRHRAVEQMTWVPGKPTLINDRLIMLEGGWIDRPDMRCFNLYKSPIIAHGDPTKATAWLDHVRKVFGDGADHNHPVACATRAESSGEDQSRLGSRRCTRHRQGHAIRTRQARRGAVELP